MAYDGPERTVEAVGEPLANTDVSKGESASLSPIGPSQVDAPNGKDVGASPIGTSDESASTAGLSELAGPSRHSWPCRGCKCTVYTSYLPLALYRFCPSCASNTIGAAERDDLDPKTGWHKDCESACELAGDAYCDRDRKARPATDLPRDWLPGALRDTSVPASVRKTAEQLIEEHINKPFADCHEHTTLAVSSAHEALITAMRQEYNAGFNAGVIQHKRDELDLLRRSLDLSTHKEPIVVEKEPNGPKHCNHGATMPLGGAGPFGHKAWCYTCGAIGRVVDVKKPLEWRRPSAPQVSVGEEIEQSQPPSVPVSVVIPACSCRMHPEPHFHQGEDMLDIMLLSSMFYKDKGVSISEYPRKLTPKELEEGAPVPAEVHVAVGGSDESGDGTEDNPYATIGRATAGQLGLPVIVHASGSVNTVQSEEIPASAACTFCGRVPVTEPGTMEQQACPNCPPLIAADASPEEKSDWVKLVFVVMGEDTDVLINSDVPLLHAVEQALRQTNNTSRPIGDWEVRNDSGVLLETGPDIGLFDFVHRARIFMSLHVGAGGNIKHGPCGFNGCTLPFAHSPSTHSWERHPTDALHREAHHEIMAQENGEVSKLLEQGVSDVDAWAQQLAGDSVAAGESEYDGKVEHNSKPNEPTSNTELADYLRSWDFNQPSGRTNVRFIEAAQRLERFDEVKYQLEERLKLSQEGSDRLFKERDDARYGKGLVAQMADRGALSMSKEITALRDEVKKLKDIEERANLEAKVGTGREPTSLCPRCLQVDEHCAYVTPTNEEEKKCKDDNCKQCHDREEE